MDDEHLARRGEELSADLRFLDPVTNVFSEGVCVRLTLVRHGQVQGVAPERFRGRADLVLTELGERDAAATAERLRGASARALYASPQRRAQATARAIGAVLGLDVRTLDGLCDIDYGAWQGHSVDELPQFANEIDLWYRGPQTAVIQDGESLDELAARITVTLERLRRRHPDEDVIAVGQDSVNRVALLHALGAPLSSYWSTKQDPRGIKIIHLKALPWSGAACVVHAVNDTSHLCGLSAAGASDKT